MYSRTFSIKAKPRRQYSMRFPSLEVMIQYGIYTVKELERFTKGLVPKKKINILSECRTCDFVYDGPICLNCRV
jgi:hypothetical protein